MMLGALGRSGLSDVGGGQVLTPGHPPIPGVGRTTPISRQFCGGSVLLPELLKYVAGPGGCQVGSLLGLVLAVITRAKLDNK